MTEYFIKNKMPIFIMCLSIIIFLAIWFWPKYVEETDSEGYRWSGYMYRNLSGIYLKGGLWKGTYADSPGEEFIISGNYVADQKEGVWTHTHSRGIERLFVHETEYKHGVRQGRHSESYRRGQKINGGYDNDHKTGDWRYYEYTGNIDKIETYDATGKLIKTIEYQDGKPIEEKSK